MEEKVAEFTVKIPYRHFAMGEKVKFADPKRYPEFKDKIFTVIDSFEPTCAQDSDNWVLLDGINFTVPSWDLLVAN